MNEDLVERLNVLMEYYDLSPSLFADKIGVTRSSVSHLINGRNRPSLDFIMKILQTFPEVNIYWLMNGKGSFPSQKESSSLSDSDSVHQKRFDKKEMSKIVVFYTDGTFESFEPKK